MIHLFQNILLWAFGAYVFGLLMTAGVKKTLAKKNGKHLAIEDAIWESKAWFMHVVFFVTALVQYLRGQGR